MWHIPCWLWLFYEWASLVFRFFQALHLLHAKFLEHLRASYRYLAVVKIGVTSNVSHLPVNAIWDLILHLPEVGPIGAAELTKLWYCSCGLWLLFHSLSVRVSDSESTEAFLAIRGFVDHFFKCQECREHFLQMSSRYWHLDNHQLFDSPPNQAHNTSLVTLSL